MDDVEHVEANAFCTMVNLAKTLGFVVTIYSGLKEEDVELVIFDYRRKQLYCGTTESYLEYIADHPFLTPNK